MAAPTSETFSNAYAITISGSSITLSSTTPVGGNITVTDPDGGSVSQSDTISVSPAFGAGSADTFYGEAQLRSSGSDELSGIVIKQGNNYYFLTDGQFSGDITGVHGKGSITGTTDTICFAAGTLVRTPEGEVAVEHLKRGDLVLTHDARIVSVDWVGIQTVSLRFANKMRVLPIRIRAGALAERVPSRDLLVSPDHALLVRGR